MSVRTLFGMTDAWNKITGTITEIHISKNQFSFIKSGNSLRSNTPDLLKLIYQF